MKLFNQLVITISLFTIMLMTTISFLNFNNAVEYIESQLYADASNTSHWLGISLSSLEGEYKENRMKAIIDAAFDSGYYEKICLVDINGKIIYEKFVNNKLEYAPEWFISLISIENHIVKSEIVTGWEHFGTIEVQSHSGFAYKKLYEGFIHLVNIFLAVGIIGFFVLYYLLLFILKSLDNVLEQVESIKSNKPIIQTNIPFTKEFAHVTLAMNSLVEKVQEIFKREKDAIVKYQNEIYIDDETLIHNRRYFLSKYPTYIDENLNLHSGTYIIFSIEGLSRLKREYGYQVHIHILNTLINYVQKSFYDNEEMLFARLNPNDFILILPSIQVLSAGKPLTKMMNDLQVEINKVSEEIEKYLRTGCAIGHYGPNDDSKRVLSRANTAVTIAKNTENYYIHIDQVDNKTLYLCRDELVEYLEHSKYILVSQDVVSYKNNVKEIVSQKIFLKLIDDMNNFVHFIPVGMAFGIFEKLDYFLLNNMFQYCQNTKIESTLSVSISDDFLKKVDNLEWLYKKIVTHNKMSKTKIIFYIQNSFIVREIEIAKKFSKKMKDFGHYFGIDHFIIGDKINYHLEHLTPNYLRVESTYLFDMIYSINNSMQRNSFLNLIQTVGSELVVIHVDKKEDIDNLKMIGVYNQQGIAISKPKKIEVQTIN